jgi:apolipoprotein D and lipocalin family protein
MLFRALPCLAAVVLAGCSTVDPPKTVPTVDISRYAGEWHEIESFPNKFQRGCAATRAVYTPRADGKIRVQNFCRRNGSDSSIDGTARVVPGSNGARLKVRFFWPFEGDYWILDLDKDYNWAAVGTPDRRYLWILARRSTLDPDTLQDIRGRLTDQGFEVSRLVPTPQ